MQNITYTKLETERKGIKVVLEFPCSTNSEVKIHDEVKQILSYLLKEWVNQIT